jgi:hypothetical protein
VILRKQDVSDTLETSSQKNTESKPRISGSANLHFILVVAPRGEMTLFPAGTTPFFPEIKSARGSYVQEIPRAPDDAVDQQAPV